MKFRLAEWFRKLFQRDDAEDSEEFIPEVESLNRGEIDISNPEMRQRYVRNCCDQMLEATKEIEYATREYRLVTDYLQDMEEVDALPPSQYRPLKLAAENVLRLEHDRQYHSENLGRISDDKYEEISAYADEMPGAIEKMKKNEEYKYLVREDLRKLEGEKGAYSYQKREMQIRQASCRNMAVITIIALIFAFLMLFVLQYFFRMEVILGGVIAAAAAAVALTWIFVEFLNAKKGLKKSVNYLNQVIAKQNTVKIRYVNVENLLTYEYQKFHVHSSDELEYNWELYSAERRERRLASEAGSELGKAQEEYVRALKNARLRYPAIWLHQAYAMVDRREMVELRHDLVARRGSLRKRIQYNTDNRQRARDEVNDLVHKYPNYAQEIIDIVSTYE